MTTPPWREKVTVYNYYLSKLNLLSAFPRPVVTARVPCRSTDTEAELSLVREGAVAAGAADAVVCSHWGLGGSGAQQLAEAVMQHATADNNKGFKYDLCTTRI